MEQNSERLRHLLNQLAAEVITERDLEGDLSRLARLAVNLVDVATSASFAMLIDDEVQTVAARDRIAIELDVAQYANDEGPCLTALGGNVVRVGWLPGDTRFPHFAIGAADQRIASVLSVPLVRAGDVVGTMNVYSTSRDAFDARAEDTVRVIAAEAAIVIATSFLFEHAHEIRDDLQQDHDDEVQIEQAQHVLMAFQECSAEQALELLGNAAHTRGEEMVEAARSVLEEAVRQNRPAQDDSRTQSPS